MIQLNYILSIVSLFGCIIALGQSTQPDTLPPPPPLDTLPPVQDSLPIDTALRDTLILPDNVEYADDAFEAQVDYGAEDSMLFDVVEQKVYLYGKAYLKYQTINLEAGHIIVDLKSNSVIAEPFRDSSGRLSGMPDFKDQDQGFVADKLQYDFTTSKGIVYEATSQEGDLYVHAQKAKYIGKGGKDSNEDVIFSKNALVTTCNLDHPHFGIMSSKQKVVPNKVVIIGPSNLQIADVPTPVVLPFGFFPITEGKTAGLVFPRDYERSRELGFGLRNIGYYTPLGEKADVEVLFDAYTRGTFRVAVRPRYVKRYKYNGSLFLRYSNRRSEFPNSTEIREEESFTIQWNHQQGSKAHPYNTFGGGVDIQINNDQQLNDNNAEAVLNNQLSSNMTFTRNFPNSPFTLNTSLTHSQNTRSREVTVNFPNIDLQMQNIYPFKRRNKVGSKERWYERIAFDYDARAFNQFNTVDSLLFTEQTLRDAEFGATHSISTDASLKFLKFLTVTPRFNYDEDWYFRVRQGVFDPTLGIEEVSRDTVNGEIMVVNDTTYGTFSDTLVNRFKSFRRYDLGISIFTQIFGTAQFKKGWLRGIRHTIKPNIGFTFEPDYTDPRWGYFETVQTSSDPSLTEDERFEERSIFPSVSGLSRPTGNGQQMRLTYGFNNLFEAKTFSKRDSSFNKLSLLRNVNINGSYNFAADSFQFSRVSISGTTDIFWKVTNFQFRASFDPYSLDEEGNRENVLAWNGDRRPLRFENATFRFNSNLTVSKLQNIIDNFNKGKKKRDKEDGEEKDSPAPPKNELLDIINGMRLSHTLAFRREFDFNQGKDTTFVSTHSLSLSIQSVRLSPKWNVRIGNIGYDFRNQRLTYPDFSFSRDLHCWEMGISTQPQRGTFAFFIRVKPGSLDFINIPIEKNQVDAFGQF